MLFSRSQSIERKLSIAVLAAVTIAVLIGAVASAWRETGRRFASQRDLIHGTAITVAASVAAPLAARDQTAIARSVNVLRALPNIRYGVVIDRSGAHVFEVGNGIVLGDHHQPLAANLPVSVLGSLRLGTYLASVPIVLGGEPIGTLALVADLTELQNALIESVGEAFLAGLVAALLALAAVAKLKRMIMRPIQELTTAAQDLRSRRDYNHTVAKHSDDETGVLVDAFNALMEEIARRDAELLGNRDDLAGQVEERTRELSIAKDDAQRANAAKSQFLATISHEIRTPMNGMIATAELLAEEIQTARGKRQCEIVLRSAHTLLAIINDVLDLSKIEAGQLTLETMDCDVADVAESVAELFGPRAFANNLALVVYVAPDVPRRVRCDPLRLRQILTNLTNNALKFTQAGGVRVDVRCVHQNTDIAQLRFEVRDTGIGISPEVMARLFQSFVQADSSTTRQFGGTGMGLAICRRLATAMGGEVGATSTLGAGSTFFLELPVAVVTPAETASIETHQQMQQAAILLPPGLEYEAARQTLADLGYAVTDELGAAAVVIYSAPLPLAGCPEALRSNAVRILTPGSDVGENVSAHPTIERPFSSRQLKSAITSIWVEEKSAHAKVTATAVAHANYAGMRVLAADDDPINREVLRQILERFGVEVVEATSGRQALTLATASEFDLIFMDGHMPEMDGFEATCAIRQWEHQRQRAPVAIVALTAIVLNTTEINWADAGFSDVVSKPITLAAIAACMSRWLDQKPTSAKNDTVNADRRGVLDYSVLDAIRDLQTPGDQLLHRMIGLYIEHATGHLARIVDARTKDFPSIAKAAHALKSLSLNMGVTGVAELCERIETDANDGVHIDGATWEALTQAVAEAKSALIQEQKLAA